MLRIYYGPDTYSRTQAVALLKQGLDRDGMLSINTTTLDGANLDLAALIAACDTVPFLSDHRLVVVNGFLGQGQSRAAGGRTGRRGRGGADPTGAGASPSLLAYVPRMPDSTTLLLLEGTLREDNSLLGSLRALGDVHAFPLLNEQQLIDWVGERARALGARFEPQAARLLAQTVRGDLWVMASEVEKLALYVGQRAVGESDVRRMVTGAQESNVFAMVDAIVDGRTEFALQQLELLLQGGAAGPYLVTMIARQFRQLIVAQDLAAAGAPQSAIAQAAEIRSPSALRRALQSARLLDPRLLVAMYERILEADLSVKRGEVDEGIALDLLVNDLARRRPAPAGRQPRVPGGNV